MFKGLGNLASLVNQAKQFGDRMQSLSTELRAKTVTGSAGAGMVNVEANGLQEVLRCEIAERLIQQQDKELLEDLVAAAVNDALNKARELHQEAVQSMTGGMNLPGLQETLAKMTDQET